MTVDDSRSARLRRIWDQKDAIAERRSKVKWAILGGEVFILGIGVALVTAFDSDLYLVLIAYLLVNQLFQRAENIDNHYDHYAMELDRSSNLILHEASVEALELLANRSE